MNPPRTAWRGQVARSESRLENAASRPTISGDSCARTSPRVTAWVAPRRFACPAPPEADALTWARHRLKASRPHGMLSPCPD